MHKQNTRHETLIYNIAKQCAPDTARLHFCSFSFGSRTEKYKNVLPLCDVALCEPPCLAKASNAIRDLCVLMASCRQYRFFGAQNTPSSAHFAPHGPYSLGVREPHMLLMC